MKSNFKHLSYEERVIIEYLYKSKSSIREIAKVLNRSPNTVSYELRKNKVNNIYLANKAKHKAYFRRYRCKKDCMKVSMNKEIKDFVHTYIKSKWSPERISGYLRRQNILVSSKAIYKYVKSRCLEHYLMHKGKKKNKGYYRHVSYLKGERKYIEERILTEEMGHYELDFIVSGKSKYVLLVSVDKYTKYTNILLLPNRKHSTIVSAFYELFSNKLIKSITTDNDIAFSKWKQLEKLFNTKIYFTHPYHSWEKGLVENTNRWIRVYISKKTDLSKLNSESINSALYYLNHIPRQCLDYRTSYELYYKHQINYLQMS